MQKHPSTKKTDVVEDFFGTPVHDPYRWLEDDNSEETKRWVSEQNAHTFAYLDTIKNRGKISARMTELWNFEKYDTPFKRGRFYFYSYNTGLQNQFVYYVTEDIKQKGKVLIDPNGLSKDGTVALSGMAFSEDGRLMAYAVSESGSDWQTWKVRDVETGKDHADEICWSKASGASWLADGSGFYYSRFAEPVKGDELSGVNQNHKVYFHKLGTKQSADELVYERPDQPEWYLGAEVSHHGRWLIITAGQGCNPESAIFVKDLQKPGSAIVPLLDKLDAAYRVIEAIGDDFYILTNNGAPRYRLVSVKAGAADPVNWTEIIPEAPGKDVLDSATLVGHGIVASWMHDAHSKITFHGPDGKLKREIALPGIGTAYGFMGKPDDDEAFYSFSSFNNPGFVLRYDFITNASSTIRAPELAGFRSDDYEVKQVFYPSKDGAKIPMFIVHKKGMKLNGDNPTLLYGYGGFNISLTPGFSISRTVWLEMGGVFAVANLRGGGEYGQEWYDAGRLGNKQNVFDDFIAAAQWLIDAKYTKPSRLAINGGSNGGLLVGACLVQRPELFGAAIPEVGVMDMLRFHKFTLGWGWKSDYGSSETKEGFDTLIKYSPLHNVKTGGSYPSTMVMTGDHDDRVVPAHSHKFTATLQEAQGGDAPILTRIETSAGHGSGKPTTKIIQERSDMYAFLCKSLGLEIVL